MKFFGLKALKAFVLAGIVSGLVVSCENGSPVAKSVAPEAEIASSNAATDKSAASTMTAEEREAKKREFFAKPEVKEMSAGLEEIAQAVAVAVEEKDLRDRIYAKCMEKFDGETNVLWQQLEADATLKSKGGWSKKVDSELGKGRKNVVVKGIGNVDAAIKKFEKAFNAPLHLFWAFPAKTRGTSYGDEARRGARFASSARLLHSSSVSCPCLWRLEISRALVTIPRMTRFFRRLVETASNSAQEPSARLKRYCMVFIAFRGISTS